MSSSMSYVLQAHTDTLLGTIMLKELIYMVGFSFFFFSFFSWSDVLCML